MYSFTHSSLKNISNKIKDDMIDDWRNTELVTNTITRLITDRISEEGLKEKKYLKNLFYFSGNVM